MSNRKISELPAAITIDPTDLLPIVDVSDSTTKRATVAQIAALAGGTISGTIAATQIAFGAGADAIGGDSGLTWDNLLKLVKITESGDFTNLLATGFFSKAAGSGSNEIEVNVSNGSGLPIITALNGATGGVIDLSPGTIRFRAQSAGPAPTPLLIDVDSNVLELGTVEASGIEIGSASAAVTISSAFTLPVTDGYSGQVLATDGAGAVSWAAAPSTPPGGAADSVQINDGYGGFIGYSSLTWDDSQSTLTAPVLALAEGVAPAGTSARGKLWANSAADARPYWTDDTGQNFNLTLDRFNTLAPGATVIIDTDPVLPVFNSVTLNQDTTFATAVGKLGNGRSASVRVVCDGTTRSLTFPTGPGGWTWLGSGPPAVLAAGDVGYLSITAYGTTDADVVAAWSYENMPAGISGTGTATRVAFWDTSSTLSSSSGLYWDNSNSRLGVGTVSPNSSFSVGASSQFQVSSTGDIVAIRGQTTMFPPANAAGVLTNNGSGTLSWAPAAAGTVTSVTLAASTTGLTISGGASQTITSSGTFTLGGTLAVANGGTGTSTAFAQGSVVFAGASGVYAQNNTALFWDDSNNRLGVGTGSPLGRLDVATGQLLVGAGNASLPAIASRTQTNTGIFFSGTSISFSTAGLQRAVVATGGNFGVGTSSPTSALSVGASSQFQVDSAGDLVRINNIPYTFPPTQGAAGTILANDGYGALSWAENAAQATSAPISTKSSNYTLTTADGTILVNAASGGITITLPAAASAAESIFTIKKKDVTFNIVAVAAAGAELIDGAPTYPLSTQYEAIKIQSDGSAWWII